MWLQIKLLFAAERQLCDEIWARLDPHREKAFADVTDSSVHMLLSFGEAIARSKKTPEKMFVLLDMYEIMRDLQPEVTTLKALNLKRQKVTVFYMYSVVFQHDIKMTSK